jgi:dTDP-glucose 4,6-dehydratase
VNIGNPSEITVLELAKEIIAMVEGTKSTIIYEPLPQDDPKRRRPDITRAQQHLGWNPTIDRADGLKRTLEYFRTVL